MNLQHNVLFCLCEEYLSKNGRLWGKVVSPSMEPLIQAGDNILCVSIKNEQVGIGDIIAFKREEVDMFITHRVIWRKRINGKLYFLEKGDRIDIATWIPEDAIIGKVKTIKRNGKPIANLDNGKWFILISKLFALYQLSGYVFGKKINSFKNWAKEYKAISFLKKPCRYCYNTMKKIRKFAKKHSHLIFVKVIKL